MKPFLNFIQAMERDMGWVRIQYHDANGNVTHIEQFGDDPLDDRVKTPKTGYWQDPDAKTKLSTEEDEDGL